MELKAEQKEQVARICDRLMGGNIDGALILFATTRRGEDVRQGVDVESVTIEGFSCGDIKSQLSIFQAIKSKEEEMVKQMVAEVLIREILK
jgi:hypothetical protein